MRPITTSAYIQLRPRRNLYGERKAYAMTPAKMTVHRPVRPDADCIVVKVNLSVPDDAFDPIPVVNVEIPVEDVTRITASSEPVDA